MVLLSEMELSAMRVLFVIVLIQQQKARNVESKAVQCLHIKLNSVFEYNSEDDGGGGGGGGCLNLAQPD